MKIVHVIDTLEPSHGGPPAVAENLARAQAALGHHVRLAVQFGEKSHFIPTLILPHCSAWQLFLSPPPLLVEMVKLADVLHLHGVWEPLLASTARAGRQLGVPYVIAPHGLLDPWSLAQRKWKKRLALALGFRRMLNGAAALHVLNDDERRLLEPLGLRPPSEVIPNGIFPEELEPPPDPVRFRLFRVHPQGPGGRPYIIFLSRLHHKKGLDYLADAFAWLAPRHLELLLVVAGPDAGEEASFRRRVAELNLTERVRFPGALYGADKWSALAGAAAFVLPSRQEGFSVAILEAMACRVPVVISENCHFPEVANVGAGAVVPLDAGAIATALDQIIRDPATAQQMGDAGRKLVEERFTWPRIAKRSIEVYERLARSARLS